MQIDANGIRLEVELHGPGSGAPIILIRGLGTQLVHWPAALTEGLAARGFRVVIFDNRDVGLSQRCPAPGVPSSADEILEALRRGVPLRPAYTLNDMARDVVGLMDALDIPRAHVFGISMGGAIAQILALDHGARLLTATFVMTACGPFSAISGSEPESTAELTSRLLSRPQGLADYVASQIAESALWGSPGFPATDEELREMAACAHARGVDAQGINRQFLAVASQHGRCEALRRLALPCLVIHGTHDALIPPDKGRELADIIPGGEYKQIDGMGHMITTALAPLIVETVSDFVARRAG
ncbi:alpha/beta fold hydrolase [Jhaorihella thermophila]|nr:alpha/beta fold hydrolase [Jhaorihella thermophila]